MGINFIWDDKYSVGNKEIDDQHRYLFELASSLPESLEDGPLKKTIMALYKYALKHFNAEEEMMRAISYPDAVAHSQMHNDLVSRLNEISMIPFKNDEDLIRFKLFVYDWVIEHIMHQDKKFFDYARQIIQENK